MEKTCNKCHETNPSSDFREGRNQCKSCIAVQMREWELAHIAERIAYRHAHAIERAAYSREWALAHPERITAILRKHRLGHDSKGAIHRREWRRTHPIETAAQARKYNKAHPEKNSARQNARRACKKNALGYNYTTAEMIRARWEMFENCCYLCGRKAQETDHVKPLTKGGAHYPCNLRPICKSCNSRKNDRWPYDAAYLR